MTQEERRLFIELVNTLRITDRQLQCEVESKEDWELVFKENANLIARATSIIKQDRYLNPHQL